MSDWRPRRIGEVWTRREGDEVAIYIPSTGQLVQLNSSALAIWELCDGETLLEEITEAIVEVTGRARAEVAADVEATIARLVHLALIERDEGAR